MVGREQRMIELKREVNYLLEKLGKDLKVLNPPRIIKTGDF